MKEKVYFIQSSGKSSDAELSKKLKEVITSKDLLNIIEKRDMVAIKTHFGEGEKNGYVRPEHIKALGELVKEKNGNPFVTETQTLYKGNRNDAVRHINHAHRQGFGYNKIGMPIIMADGLYGDEEIEVVIPGKIYKSVKLASLIVKSQALIVVSHFTGHLATGFGCAIKNMGMGCSSRKGKMNQHSTAKPKIIEKRCTQCGMCVKWCPAGAITMKEESSALISSDICIGCGQCLAVCRFDSVAYNWSATYEELQKKVVEHAMGVAAAQKGKIIYINFLIRISKDCDCLNAFEEITPDIGILISYDPVAIDKASLDLVEKKSGKKLSEMSYDIPYMFQIDYSRELNFGNADYELEEV